MPIAARCWQSAVELRDAVREFVADLDDVDEEVEDQEPTTDVEAVTAVEAAPEEARRSGCQF